MSGDPPSFYRPEKPGSQLSIRMDGVKVDGRDELIEIIKGDDGYESWLSDIIRSEGLEESSENNRRQIARDIAELAMIKVRVTATCIPSLKGKFMWPPENQLDCDEGEGLGVELTAPLCRENVTRIVVGEYEKDNSDKRVLLTLFDTRDVVDEEEVLVDTLGARKGEIKELMPVGKRQDSFPVRYEDLEPMLGALDLLESF